MRSRTNDAGIKCPAARGSATFGKESWSPRYVALGIAVVRLELSIDLLSEVGPRGADFVFDIHGAHMRCQVIGSERLDISQPVLPQVFTVPVSLNGHTAALAPTHRGCLHTTNIVSSQPSATTLTGRDAFACRQTEVTRNRL